MRTVTILALVLATWAASSLGVESLVPDRPAQVLVVHRAVLQSESVAADSLAWTW